MSADLTIDGVCQPIEEWALDYGIPADLIELRLKAGWTPKDAVETEMPITRLGLTHHMSHLRKGKYEAHGYSLTIPEWSEMLGLHASTLRTRLKAGLSLEEVFKADRRSIY